MNISNTHQFAPRSHGHDSSSLHIIQSPESPSPKRSQAHESNDSKQNSLRARVVRSVESQFSSRNIADTTTATVNRINFGGGTGILQVGNGDINWGTQAFNRSILIQNSGTLTISISRPISISSNVINSGTFLISVENLNQPISIKNYTQNLEGTLSIQLHGSDFSARMANLKRLIISEEAQLSGKLQLYSFNGTIPRNGEEFTLLVATQGITGKFDTVDTGGLNFEVIYSPTDVKLKFLDQSRS